MIFWVELVRHKIAARIQIAGGLREMKGFENGKWKIESRLERLNLAVGN